MDVAFGLFSERLRRLLAGEEVTLPDAAKQHVQKLYSETEIVASWLKDYEYDMFLLLLVHMTERAQIELPDLHAIMEKINGFAYVSEKIIDTFVIGESSSNDILAAMLGLRYKIIDIKQRMQHVQHIKTEIINQIKLLQIQACVKKKSIQIQNDKMENLLDQLIEGQPQLSVVVIIGNKEFDMTALIEKAYNSNYVKNYFDCRASVSLHLDVKKMLEDIMKSVMPLSMFREIMDKDYELKKAAPHDYEPTAEKYLTELIRGGFVQVKKTRPGGTIKTICIPSIIWVKSMKIAALTEFIISFPFQNISDIWASCKRISFTAFPDLLLLSEFCNTYLHSLLHLTSERELVDPIDWEKMCRKFKILRVLDLGSRVLRRYSTEIEQLLHLRYLKLDIPSLKSLPSSLLCNLLNFYTLDMPSSYIDHTADDIWKMNKLRHMNFGLITLPPHTGKYCSSLENLNFISTLHPNCCTPDILGRLPNL